MKKVLYPIIKISAPLLTIPFWFIKFFVGIGHMPNVDTGKIEEVRSSPQNLQKNTARTYTHYPVT